ncbi:MAG: diguanylate cyclase [Sulfuritalea sp.]|nr:diguanylate cyclase [Sulfuritalea sp.]
MRLFLLLAVLLPLPASALEQVTLQLKWQHQFQFAGYYAAAAQGYYRDAGLDVRFVEAGPDTDPVAEVVSGRAQYGVSNSALILARARGEPVVALAVIFQHSPFILAVRAGAGIRSVRDLAGKRLMIEPHADEIYAYLRREGLHESRLVIKPHSFKPQDLIDGRTDVMTAYSTDEPFFFEQRGFRHIELSPRTAGIDFYGDNLFTSTREIAGHPARVRAFREASLKGWRHAMAHPEETVDLILAQYGRRHSRPHLLYEANKMVPLLQTGLVDMGYMSVARWRHIAATYAELDMLPRNFSVEGFLYEPAPDTRMTWALTASTGVALVLAAALAGLFGLTRKLKREIAVRSRLEETLLARRAAIEAAADGFVITDTGGIIEYVNPALTRIAGYTAGELIGKHTRIFRSGFHDKAFYDDLWQTVSAGRVWRGEVLNRRQDGSLYTELMAVAPVLDESGKVIRYVAIKHDISERKAMETALKDANQALQQQIVEIEELQMRLKEQVVRDPLTGLHNRRFLDETLSRELARAKREGYPVSLLMIDVDHFKRINDTYGHPAGDELLKALAGLLRASCREGDIACRYGGEEFIALLPRAPADIAHERAEQWRESFAALVTRHGEFEIRATFSAGIASFPQHAHDPDNLVERADAALYAAKQAGRNRCLMATS